MDVFAASERVMGMDEATWSRHANPLSVYSRFSILPLFSLAIWSRDWLGAWALVPVALVVLWTWINPRLFAEPDTTNTWAGRGVFGERVFLNRADVPIPAHHVRWGYGLSIAAGLGVLPLIWGLYALSLPWTVTGLILSMGAKLWFVDRMTFLFDDMKDAHPTYASWMR